jgi:hypothetical protein
VGGVDGILKDYLNAVFETLSQPLLARRVVWSLVIPTNPPIRALRSAGEIATELRTPERQVQVTLDELVTPHVVQARPETSPVAYELVHDVLVEPALRATTPQETGLSIIRSALARRRRRLTRREYRAATRSDLTELPTRQQSAARRLLRRTLLILRGIDLVVVCCGLLLLVTGLQFSSVHVHIESYSPEPLVVCRGLWRLDFLPGFLGPKPLFDTGLTVADVPSYKRSAIEGMTLRPWDNANSTTIRSLFEHLEPESAAWWLFYRGDWQEGMRILAAVLEKNPWRRDAALAIGIQVVPGVAIPSILTLLTENEPPTVRSTVARYLGLVGDPQADTVVPALLPLLHDGHSNVRRATVGALQQLGVAQADTLMPALLPLLRDGHSDVRRAAVEILAASLLLLTQQEHEQPVYNTLIAKLTESKSRLDALHRQIIVLALARWYHAGYPEAKTSENFSAEETNDKAWQPGKGPGRAPGAAKSVGEVVLHRITSVATKCCMPGMGRGIFPTSASHRFQAIKADRVLARSATPTSGKPLRRPRWSCITPRPRMQALALIPRWKDLCRLSCQSSALPSSANLRASVQCLTRRPALTKT